MKDVVVVEALRTPIGRYGGILKSVRPDDLGALVLRKALERARVDPASVDDVYFGCSNQAGEDNRNVARMATLLAGIPYSVPGATVNRLCGSGLEAINSAARVISSGEGDVLLAGGVESMTRAPLVTLKPEAGFERGGVSLVDTTIGWRFVNPAFPQDYPPLSMGETAENLAEKYSISRESQDEFALCSHRKAVEAARDGRFSDEVIPVVTPEKPDGTAEDEGPRKDTSLEKLSKLRPAFRKGGTVTAGNSSGINDGASALVLMRETKAKDLGLRPIARVIGSATAGVHPSYMGLGPVYSTKKLLSRLGMEMEEFGVVELNEAFAAQVLACAVEMPELNLKKTNPNGGAIALGHPLGCSGARIATTLLHQMRRTATRYGLAAMCIGVGQGISTAFELMR
ncbi:MAG: thiolase family protein [Nitrososphaerota archaeon]|nr:thiolase family protein [Nitrososphaerota archaeon]MDG6952419.1 thiolase family protein [Nitrososphaerota archaeon]MDG6958749.1 thiolase family protein [Nitrososphaerota archaeon]MDG6961696.1 thiolase family protein [Nitrososphaerota archaeon]MDG6962992.1 thiolase family protein [Nitrososphaerota archaeon]